jgi:hypothetical protein
VLAHISGTGSHNVADYMDLTLIDTLRSTGFFAAMAQKYGKQ